MSYFHIPSYLGTFWGLVWQQVYMAGASVLFGFLISLPLGLICARWKRFYPPVLGLATVFYSIPSLAIFVILIDYTGATPTTVIIPLSVYTIAVLLPNIVDGLHSVSDEVRLAATAMGFTGLRRLVRVELPIAVPAIMAGLRVATVGNISMASVGVLIGVGSLGSLFVAAAQLDRPNLAVTGIIAIVVIALVADMLLIAVQWLLTPWNRRRRT